MTVVTRHRTLLDRAQQEHTRRPTAGRAANLQQGK
jgi:hypothetical protein